MSSKRVFDWGDPSFSVWYFAAFSWIAWYLAYMPLYWEYLGFDRRELAQLSLTSTLGALVAGPLILSLAHSVLSARTLALILSPVAILTFVPQLTFTKEVFSLFLVTWFICSLSTKGLHSLVDAAVVRASGSKPAEKSERKVSANSQTKSFERTRVWGSIGYVVSTILAGLVFQSYGASAIGSLGAIVLAAVALVTFLTSRKLAPKKEKDKAQAGISFWKFISSRKNAAPICALFIVNALVWASHAAYYTYYSVYLKQLGFDGLAISIAWSIGVIAEVAFFFVFTKYAERFSLVSILRQAVIFTTLRWLLLAWSESLPVLLFAQVLHLYSFGALYLASVKLTYSLLPDELRDRGQGYLAAFSSGVGSSLGRYLCSLVALQWTIPEMFLASAVVSVIGLPLTFLISSRLRNQAPT